MTRHTLRALVAASVLVAGVVPSVDAGGPLLLRAPGQPYRWGANGVGIPFNPDQGGLGPLTNAEAVAQTTAAFAAWEALPTSAATHVNAGQLSVDVDETNFLPFLQPAAPDGLSAIVYDEDGAIFTLLFGAGSGVLGFASPEWLNTATGEIIEGVSFMNGGSLVGPGAFPVAEFLSVQVHEFGHYQNLAHTVVNGQVAGFADHNGPTPFNTFAPVSLANRIETMYPFLFINGGQATPHPDDIAIFSFLYPAAGWATSVGTITGRILAPNGTTAISGVNVIARNVANPFDDAVSAISSDFTDSTTSGEPFVGVYTIRGLTPGAQYAVFVDTIIAGGFSTTPRNPLPGVEEFYNGANESSNSATDDPSVFTAVSAAAGATTSNIDIIFNEIPPGPITLGDDASVEIFSDFPIRFCGQAYDSVWVNSNGSLTFGVGSTAFGESAAGMLLGPPRLAALWDDLNPAAGGVVSWEQTNTALIVHFTNVPEFSIGGSNTFTITLRRQPQKGGRYSVEYGALSAVDGAAGYSCGGDVTSGFELETDLSPRAFPNVINNDRPATYEVFTALDNDLDTLRFDVVTPRPFEDDWEPNDDGSAALPILNLPFSTHADPSFIGPGDVDYFRFHFDAGDIVAIETVPGAPLDTVAGIFDDAGNLLLADDDSGVGTLSRLLVQILVAGTYKVGVSTYPDLTFTGAGEDGGRYVLSVRTYRGTIIPVGDDSAVNVPLTTFQFPFNGTLYPSLFVNGNGNITFGAASSDFSETVAEFLAGAPRIAPLWDDLNPTAGLVIAEPHGTSLSVHFVSVPEFLATGTNYFSVNLDQRGNVIVDYGATNRSDALVGVTQGGGATDPGPRNLSSGALFPANGTTYETFVGSFGTFGGVDLSFLQVVFKKP